MFIHIGSERTIQQHHPPSSAHCCRTQISPEPAFHQPVCHGIVVRPFFNRTSGTGILHTVRQAAGQAGCLPPAVMNTPSTIAALNVGVGRFAWALPYAKCVIRYEGMFHVALTRHRFPEWRMKGSAAR